MKAVRSYNRVLYPKWWTRVRIHPSWHMMLFLGGVLAGLMCAPVAWTSAFSSVAYLLIGVVGLMVALWKQFRWLLIIALLAGCLVGASRGAADMQVRAQWRPYYGKTLEVTGRVSEDIDSNGRGVSKIRLQEVRVGSHVLQGRMWVTMRGDVQAQRSDVITVQGKVEEGFAQFSASMMAKAITRIERDTARDPLLGVRDSFAATVRQSIDEPMASLGLGFLTGQRRSLPPDLEESLKIAGLTHIIVASGYNLTILVRLAKRLFEKISRYLTVVAGGGLIVLFLGITGLSPSMTRAGLVAGAVLVAWYFGRRFHPVMILLLAAAVTGLYDPSFVWGDMGWQLSFAAFGGVMLLAPLLQTYFFGEKPPGTLRQIVGETVSAQICTLPLILYAFGSTSLVALAANVAVVPLIPLAMLAVFIVGVLGYVLPGLASVIAIPVDWLLSYMIAVAEYLAGFDWAVFEYSLPLAGMALVYTIIIACGMYMKRATRYDFRQSSVIE